MSDFLLMFALVMADALWFGIKFAVVAIGTFVLVFAMFVYALIWLERRK